MDMLDSNLYWWDKVSRILLGGILIGSVFVLTNASLAWLALLGCYFIFTALLSWDPWYAMLAHLAHLLRHKNTMSATLPKQAFSS